ncbi:RNHCP domain protein [Poriferisphaera corsica]|uniref:RNHCP domain protein n=1 Tax=Poriferisphaera corsica TaxID=2528020 RepID=A0A517YX69_9BACT|nr:RNHCP domain-containing protein [Poriferisphaera corsica]QDU34820.1 RNHCP domain protein [Poriferisphaera corsica]
MSRKQRKNKQFYCIHCRQPISADAYGTKHRNHCPFCLWSKHVDELPGDRNCACQSAMRPIAVETRGDGEWAIVHRCEGCGEMKANRIAGDDDELQLLGLILRPLTAAPFPIDHLPMRGPMIPYK